MECLSLKSIPPALDLRSGTSTGGDPRNTTACPSGAASPGPMGWHTDSVGHREWALCCEEAAAPAATVPHKARMGHAGQPLFFTDTLIEVCSGITIYDWVALGIEWIGTRKK